jgi:uncharacterized membrane protein (UPF0136 family)
VDDAAWAALTLSLTVLGGIWTWVAFRRRGVASGLRALAFTLLPLAAYLTKTLRMFTRIVDAVTDWAAHLVFSPTTWLGLIVAAVSALLFAVSGRLRARELRKGRGTAELPAGRPAAGPRGKGRPAMAQDDDMADIEALLRKRGIS